MKIASFIENNDIEIGIVDNSFLIPIKKIDPSLNFDMISLIENWNKISKKINSNITNSEYKIPISNLKLHKPIDKPSKIFAMGLNYLDHMKEVGIKKPNRQLWFSKQVNTLSGPFDTILLPKVSKQVDYEVELVAIIGKKGKHIKYENAHNYIFGLCIGNDVSVRDWQMSTSQWMIGKSFDTHGPIGPYITTLDEVVNPHNLGIRSYVNGEIRQNSNTSNLIYNIWKQIAYLSQAITLEVGDLIFTGTPSGVGFAMKPPIYLKNGDIVKCEIDKLGYIENEFINEDI